MINHRATPHKWCYKITGASIAVPVIFLSPFVSVPVPKVGRYLPLQSKYLAFPFSLNGTVRDRDIAGNDFSGGISNVDKSLLKHDELLINNYTKEEFPNVEDLNNLKLRFSIITKYVDPNYENVYPEEYTKVMEPIYIDAKYGETYRFTV